MLELFIGTDWTANRDEILNRIAADTQKGLGNRILLVPELISHDMERRLCVVAGDTASRYAEVLSFSRLSKRVSDSVGCAIEGCLDNGGRIVAMSAAVRQVHSKLKTYASMETRPEFFADLLDAVDEFKRCCVTPADLLDASLKTDGLLAQKLEELSLILEAYDSLCSRGKRDPRDLMTWLLERIEDSDFAQNHIFYIDGFPDFTRQHFEILHYLILTSPYIAISLTCDVAGSKNIAFEKAGETAASLIRYANGIGVPVRITKVKHRDVALAPALNELFLDGTPKPLDIEVNINLRREETLYNECQAAAERVLSVVRQGGRYRDVGIICTDLSAFRNVLRLIFDQRGIPLYLSGTEDILQNKIISAIINAMEAAFCGLEQQKVLSYLKSALSPLDPDCCDQLEKYVALWKITGIRWQQDWDMHPDGLGFDWCDNARSALDALNSARQLAVTPLIQLRRGFSLAKNLRDQVVALYTFFEQIGLAERLHQLSCEMEQVGDWREAQILNQIWEILLCSMEQLHDVLGETVWDAESFLKLFVLLLSQYDVGTIPPVLDSVMAGSVSAMRCQQVKHLIVLGAQEGLFPSYASSSGILTEQERQLLRGIGVPVLGGGIDSLQTQFAEIYGVFCGADQSMMVSSSGGQISFLYRRLCAIVGKEAETDTYLGVYSNPNRIASMLLRCGADEAAHELGVTQAYQNLKRHTQYAMGIVSGENVRNLYGQTLKLSASQIDRQAECRFSYFLRYGLRAKEWKEATVDPAEFGTYVHAVLEQTAKDVMAKGGFHVVSLSDTMEIATFHSEKYASERFNQLDSKRVAYLFRRNVLELQLIVEELWQELHSSQFEPVDFELSFGAGAKMESIPIESESIQAELRGFVDRVDVWKCDGINYFRVVDYKTGKKDFDYCDVFNGLGLQMLLYLFALEREGSEVIGQMRVPAGVQYFPARASVISSGSKLTKEQADAERNKGLRRKGLVLAEEQVLRAMEPENGPKRLNCTVKKDGTITGDIASRGDLALLRRYIFYLLKKMVTDIASGNVEPNPYTRGTSHDACSYCPYGSVCHYQHVEGRRNYRSMSAQRFWDEVRKEMDRYGR